MAHVSDPLYQERVRRARLMSLEEKVWAGEELFHMAAAITLAGIRREQPELDDAGALQVLKQRLAERRARESQHG
jgi:hypothetical protein